MGMKRVLTGVIVLSSVFVLVSCAKSTTTTKSTTAKPTSSKITTSRSTTAKPTTKASTTTRRTTAKPTTTEAPVEYLNKLKFVCFSNEVKNIIDNYYPLTDSYDATTTYLHDGTFIEWDIKPNNGTYKNQLEDALDNDEADMFMFEARYTSEYFKTDKFADLSTITGFDTSHQFKATKDIVTYDGKLKGVSWFVCPGTITYNQNVADKVWGTWDGDTLVSGVTYETVANKLSTKEKFMTAAQEVHARTGLYMLCEPNAMMEMYACNLKGKMYDDKNTSSKSDDIVTIDQSLFDWAKDSKYYYTEEQMKWSDDTYNMWNTGWSNEIKADNVLCYFSTSWMNDYVFPEYRYDSSDEPTTPIGEKKDANLRVVKSFNPFIWNGTWLGASNSGMANPLIKDSIASILKALTANKDVQKAIALGTNVIPNNDTALYELANDTSLTVSYYGGQNLYQVYAKALVSANLENSSFEDNTIYTYLQSAFSNYIRGTKTMEQAWDMLKTDLSYVLGVSKSNIILPDGKTDIEAVFSN